MDKFQIQDAPHPTGTGQDERHEAEVCSIAVVAPQDLEFDVDIDAGHITNRPIKIIAIHDDIVNEMGASNLEELLRAMLSRPPLSKLGINIEYGVISRSELGDEPALSYEPDGDRLELFQFEFSKSIY